MSTGGYFIKIDRIVVHAPTGATTRGVGAAIEREVRLALSTADVSGELALQVPRISEHVAGSVQAQLNVRGGSANGR